MKIYILVILFFFSLMSCQNFGNDKSSEKDIELQKRELDIKQKELELKEKQLQMQQETQNQKPNDEVEVDSSTTIIAESSNKNTKNTISSRSEIKQNLTGVYKPKSYDPYSGYANVTLKKMCEGYLCMLFSMGGSGSSTLVQFYKPDGNNLISPGRDNISTSTDHITLQGMQYYIDKSQKIDNTQKCFLGEFVSGNSRITIKDIYNGFDIMYWRGGNAVAYNSVEDFSNTILVGYNSGLQQSIKINLIDDNNIEVEGITFKRKASN